MAPIYKGDRVRVTASWFTVETGDEGVYLGESKGDPGTILLRLRLDDERKVWVPLLGLTKVDTEEVQRVKTKKPMELEPGDVIEAGASLDGVYTLEVEGVTPSSTHRAVYVGTCELDWPLTIPIDDDVTVVSE